MNKQFLTALSDTWGLLIVVLFVMFAVAVANMHKQTPVTQESPISEAGVIQVLAIWPDKSCDDIDLWMKSPGDAQAAGFLNRDSHTTNLMRDDLGCTNDSSGLNFEQMQTHGIPAGEYVVNVHWFKDNDHTGPVKVHIIGQMRPHVGDVLTDVFDEWVTLKAFNDEETVIRFTLDEKGHVVFTSHLPISIVPPEAKNMSAGENSYGLPGSHT